jgi:predicted nucleic acid-binding protein
MRADGSMPLTLSIELNRSIELSHSLNIYAYDAYLLACTEQIGGQLLTLDRGLVEAARRGGFEVVEVVN